MTLEELKAACAACQKCPLGATRQNSVFGDGDERAELLFVGEAPGEQEDLSGVPFVGRAGKLLNAALSEVGIARDRVYIANVLKCRPPENRDPLPSEVAECLPYLKEQIRLVAPKMIVCLGRISAMRFIKKDFKMTAEHGQWFMTDLGLTTAIYHPAFVLRDPRKREGFLDDLKAIKEKLSELT